MNYIKHLSTFFEMVADDNRLTSHHVSLYFALFQIWNINRFVNPFQVNRAEVLQICKIGSFNTYHKCLHDLHLFGYIQYIPSHNPMKGSQINLYKFDTTHDTTLDANSIQHLYNTRRKNDTTDDTTLASLYKHNKHINNKTYIEQKSKNEIENLDLENLEIEKKKRKKVAAKKENKFLIPHLDEVLAFFQSENFPEIEAQKFFNHFESNGWKVGGKTQMKNWNAAARNWMINSQRFVAPNNQRPHLNLIKNYSEAL